MKIYPKLFIRKSSTKTNALILLLCLIVTAFLFGLGLFTGAANISTRQVTQWLLGGESDVWIHNIMLHVRLPRALASLICGAALALSGLMLQSALHNPLASAGTIGVNSGAGFFAVLASAVFPGVFAARPASAFAGALLAVLIVFGISERAGTSKSTLLMVGVAIGSLFSAGTDAIVTFRPDSVMDKTAFFIGGFSQVTMKPVLYVVPLAAAGCIGAAFLSTRMNVLTLGDEVAASLGLHVKQCRIMIIFCASLLAACAVCVGGLLGFVGLIVPHAARKLIGRDHKLLVPFTVLFGGGLVTGCDILARVLFSPYELPVGILLSMLGAPFFLLLVLRRRRITL